MSNQIYRCFLFVGLFFVLSLVALPQPMMAQQADAKDTQAIPGIVREKPTEGRFVDLGDGRFMVPFTATIPGTKITYSMQPVAGGEYKMGTDDGESDQQPTFMVQVKPFWISTYETTWAEYWRYMQMEKALKSLQEGGVRVVNDDNEIDAITAPSALYLSLIHI